MMVRFNFWFLLSLLYCLFPSASFASDCRVDPNECTLRTLCEVATLSDGGNTIWSTESSSVKHVTTAKSLGMECGVTAIVDLCETDPNECKVSEICEKATIENAGQVSWDESAAGHVVLAKEYGLQCNVIDYAKVSCSLDRLQNCSNDEICNYATFSDPPKWKEKYEQSSVKEAKKRGLSCGVGEARSTNFKQAFKSLSRLKRQQLQYALNKLGYYSYGIDGLWGKGTRSGLAQFTIAYDLKGKAANQVFSHLLSKVEAPSSFAKIKPKESLVCDDSRPYQCSDYNLCELLKKPLGYKTILRLEAKKRGIVCDTRSSVAKSSNANGLKSITPSPSVAADQAYAVCLPLAQQAKRQASNQSKQALRPTPYKSTCRRNYSGSYDCSSQRTSGGFWGGVADGVASSSAGRSAYNAVLDSCLAQYGWGN